MKIRLFIMLAAAMLAAMSCSKPSKQMVSGAAAPEMARKSSPAEADESASRADKPSPSAAAIDRKLIREGSISFKTKSLSETTAGIDRIVRETGSYYGMETQTAGASSIEAVCTVRIPAENFDRFLSLLEQHAGEFDSKKIDALDVTEEYMDLEARIRNKKELEATFRQLLAKTASISDILAVEAQIASVREEIERSEGRLRFLSKSVAFSTLTITYRQPVTARSHYGEKLQNAFSGGWNFFVNFCIALVYLWPLAALFLLFVLSVWVVYRIRKKRSS